MNLSFQDISTCFLQNVRKQCVIMCLCLDYYGNLMVISTELNYIHQINTGEYVTWIPSVNVLFVLWLANTYELNGDKQKINHNITISNQKLFVKKIVWFEGVHRWRTNANDSICFIVIPSLDVFFILLGVLLLLLLF